jgi:integrase
VEKRLPTKMELKPPGNSSGRFERWPDQYGPYWIARDTTTGIFYVCWYDSGARQTRRRTLDTNSPNVASKRVEELQKAGVDGDPKEHLQSAPMSRVSDVLSYYQEKHIPEIRSGEAATIAIKNFLEPALGSMSLASIKKRHIKEFSDGLLAKGYSVGYVSRICSVLRAAFNRAIDDEQISSAPLVPEIRDDAEMEAEDLRGRRLSIVETARLVDAISEMHMLDYTVAELNTAARPEAILEAMVEQIGWDHGLLELNPPGRVQTKKFRPIMRISQTWRPWLEPVESGPIVSYDGEPIRSIKTAMRSMVAKAGLQGRVNSTSIRHSIGHFLENIARVPGREISILLGHVPVSKKKTTRRYSGVDPYSPDYLSNAVAGIEAFVREVNKHTKKWDLEKPYTIKPGWKKS